MNHIAENTRSVVTERVFRHVPEKLWRALTEGPLLAQWLMKNDFEPVVERKFQLRAEPVRGWDGVIDCEVLVVEAPTTLEYSWRSMGLETVVRFTLTRVEGGTRLRMEHMGFGADQEAAYRGATWGWERFLGNLERLLEGGVA